MENGLGPFAVSSAGRVVGGRVSRFELDEFSSPAGSRVELSLLTWCRALLGDNC